MINGFLEGPKQSFTLDADYEMDKNNKFNLFLDYNKENLTYDVDYSSYESYGINDVYKSKQDIERRTAALTFNGNDRENEYMFGITYSRLDKEEVRNEMDFSNIMTTGVAVNTNYENRSYKMWVLEARDSIRTSVDNKLSIGMEYRYNEGSAYAESNKDDTEEYAIYIQDEWKISDKLLLLPSVRYDYHDSFGGHISPNIGLTYLLTSHSRFKANYGSAYRAPSIDELYGTFNHMGMFTIYGNPDLEPEKTKGYELSYEHEFSKNTTTKLSYFRSEKKDAINIQSLSTHSSLFGMLTGTLDKIFVNVDSTTSEGVEFEVKHNFGNGITFIGSYDWLDAKNDENGTKLAYTARNVYTAKLIWDEQAKNGWSIVAWNRWYSDYADDDGDNHVSGNTFHFNVSKHWGERYRAFFGIDNLFDKEIDELSYYGRLWHCGFEMTF